MYALRLCISRQKCSGDHRRSLPVVIPCSFKDFPTARAFTHPTPPGRLEVSGPDESFCCPLVVVSRAQPVWLGSRGRDRRQCPRNFSWVYTTTEEKHAWPLMKK